MPIHLSTLRLWITFPACKIFLLTRGPARDTVLPMTQTKLVTNDMLNAIILRIKKAKGIGTVKIRNMFQVHIPSWTGKDTREFLATLRKRKVLDYVRGRWYYIPREKRRFFMTEVRKIVLDAIPWYPEYTIRTKLLRCVSGLTKEELASHVAALHRKGYIDTEHKIHRLASSGKMVRYRVFFRIRKAKI